MALPVSHDPTDRRAAVLRMLTASPDGLSDAALAGQLGDGVRPQTVNQLCRRLVAEGALERVGTRPILNRLPAPNARRGRRRSPKAVAPAPETAPATADPPPPAAKPRRSRKKIDAEPAPEPVVSPAEPESVVSEQIASETEASAATEGVATGPVPSNGATPEPAEESSPTLGPPPYDALQAWSRAVNVQSLVAGWLVQRGATLRWASIDGTGPARDLVASLDGDDVHVEITGWPADGARTHPTTIAGDWFSAAEHAATERRRAHPRARIVIALPDTRRYRSLTEQRAASLDGARAEVWFVDAAGAVHAR